MRRFATLLVVIAAIVMVVPAAAGVFDLPATGIWTKVQDGSVIQWSAITPTGPLTRIDLVSHVQDGNRITYYLVRSACPGGKIQSFVIKPGNAIGTGLDCDWNIVTRSAATLDQVQKLPPEAAALITH